MEQPARPSDWATLPAYSTVASLGMHSVVRLVSVPRLSQIASLGHVRTQQGAAYTSHYA